MDAANSPCEIPAFLPYAEPLARYWPQRESGSWIADYNATYANDRGNRPLLRADEGAYKALAYEQKIFVTHEVPTRANNVHDLMNALVWEKFPGAKRALNRRHVAEGASQSGNQRSRVRDGLTLFDEVGIVIFGAAGLLPTLHAEHAWTEMLHAARYEWLHNLTVIVFGHGLLESIAVRPHLGLTGKVLWVDENVPSAQFDAVIADKIVQANETFIDQLRPLPVFGIPGWCVENAASSFYKNVSVFRPLSKIAK